MLPKEYDCSSRTTRFDMADMIAVQEDTSLGDVNQTSYTYMYMYTEI
jgi:hypothetical protein